MNTNEHQIEKQTNNNHDQEQINYIDNYQNNITKEFFAGIILCKNRSKTLIRIYFLVIVLFVIGIVLWAEGVVTFSNPMVIVGIIMTVFGLFALCLCYLYTIVLLIMLVHLKEIKKVFLTPMILFAIGLMFLWFAIVAAFINLSIIKSILAKPETTETTETKSE